jgi:hypothetical protein
VGDRVGRRGIALGGSGDLSAADDVSCLDHDGVAEHLEADRGRRQHQHVGVPGARIAKPWITSGEEGLGRGP